MRSLRRGFAKYLHDPADSEPLLLHLLQALVRDASLYLQLRHGRVADRVEVRAEDLEARARALGVHELAPFYTSATFREHGFEMDRERNVIVLQF